MEENRTFAPPAEGSFPEGARGDAPLEARGETKQENVLLRFLHKTGSGPLPGILSFLLPFLVFSVCLAIEGVYPFGDRQIINYDGWHQYYPFLLKLWDHFHEGTSLLYDWSMGMGTNFLSMLSYYGSSPWNLLLLLVPVREFRVLFTLFTALRIGFAGYFTGLFLKKGMGASGFSIPFFAMGYALCGYLMGYYWNNMWLDSIALFPLLCLGTVKLFREGKSTLYIASLSLCLFANYHIGYMCVLFTVLLFFILCVLDRVSFSGFFRKGFRLFLAGIWGAAIPAVLLLPAFFGLFNTVSTTGSVPVYVSFYESVRDLITPLVSFHEPAVMDGLPNLTTSALLALFAFAFLWAKKISLREKLCAFFLVLFLLFSMNFSVLNYVWHGMHFTNMIPYRFAFLFSFTVVVMAYRYYQKAASSFDWIDGAGMFLFAAFVSFCAFGYYKGSSLLATVAVFGAGIVLCALYSVKILSRRSFSVILCLILALEMTCSAFLGTGAVGSTGYSDYFDGQKGEEVQALVDLAREREKETPFFRLETTEWRSLNDSCFYHYNGVSQFASSANVRVSTFLQALGMPADPGSNRFVYVHGTPLADALLGVKYLISRNGYLSDPGLSCVSPATNQKSTALYEYTTTPGICFLTEKEAGSLTLKENQTPFERQNEIFSALTGLEGDLFLPVSATGEKHLNLEATHQGNGYYEYTCPALEEGAESERVLRLEYTVPESGMIYIYADVPLANYVQVNNAWHCIEEYPNLFDAGYFSAGSTFQLRAVIQEETREKFSDHAVFSVCRMDQALWEEGLSRLTEGKMEIETWEDTRVTGRVNAKKDGYLYTSIPMERECWEVKVDGETVPVTPFAGAFVGVYLSRGEHQVEIIYSPLGYAKGKWISLSSLLLLAALFYWEKKGHVIFPEKKKALPPVDKEPLTPENPPAAPEQNEKEPLTPEKTEEGGEVGGDARDA